MHYADVAVNVAVHQTFVYHIPPEFVPVIAAGHLVRVGFGTAMQPGIVLATYEKDSANFVTKPILELLDSLPVMTPQHLQLGRWMSQMYLAPLGMCLWLMLPPGFTGKNTRTLSLQTADYIPHDALENDILGLLQTQGALLEKELAAAIKAKELKKTLDRLIREKIIHSDPVLTTPVVKPKTIKTVQLLQMPQIELRSSKIQRILAYLADKPYPVDMPEVTAATKSTNADLQKLASAGYIALGERLMWRDSLADRDFVPSQPLKLMPDQQRIWQVIHRAIIEAAQNASEKMGQKFLLHGVTGSGKTEIYLQAIAATLALGRHTIFLVPEIALTPQTIRRVAERFPGQVAIVHGSLSQGERYDTWRRARTGEIKIIVGTRSALFTPLPDVGLIILDEEHDHSYKHAPPFNPPYYHARAVAEEMAHQHNAIMILGSATPDMETYYRAQRGDLHYLHLPERIMGHRTRIHSQAERFNTNTRYQPASDEALMIDLPPVTITDMRDELKTGNRGMFSRALYAALSGVMERGEQAMLFLNRRGQATYVFCRDCGYVAACSRCDMPMTYHRLGENLRCHHCGNVQPAPTTCPECASTRIKYFGAGTQQIEDELQKAFPGVRSIRWDADTAEKPEHHEAILAQFLAHEANILIGTQMIAKGLDLPLVTLVGVISADPGLALPDFRANERVFQLLTQVAGRAGRGILGGQVILQTYQPQHPSIIAAAQHDYAGFYTREIAARRDLGYPPFRRMARLIIQSTNPTIAQTAAEDAAKRLRHHILEQQLTDTTLIGPAPCFFSKIDRHYRWHVVLRGTNPMAAFADFKLQPGWYVDIDPVDVL
jgi:primosomal protein N' (replication factor Y)